MDIEAGTTIGLRGNGVFDVYGTLRTNGTVDYPVFIASSGGRWGRLTFFPGSIGDFHNTHISGGGATINGESVMVDVSGSDVVFDNTDIMYGRWPGILVRLRGSDSKFIKSNVGYDAIPINILASWKTTAIFVQGGQTLFDDVRISHVSYGIMGDSNTTVLARNMTVDNFIGVKYNKWWPYNMLQFLFDLEPDVLSTSSADGEYN